MGKDQAQHLVAVSINKIQTARSKRSGLNLHRSLLVSSVLFRAKTAIIMAKYNMRCEYDDPPVPEIIEDEEEEEELCESVDTEMENRDSVDEQIVPDNCLDGNVSTDLHSDTSLTEEDKENQVPDIKESNSCESKQKDIITSDVTESEKSRCNKCLKRRLTEVESAVESITKKQCSEENNCLREKQYDNCQNVSQTQESSMECGPISNLVDSFSCGFSGLLCENQAYSSTSSDGQDSNSSLQRGLSDAFMFCSTQIKDSFETLSSPIMLSV